MIQQISEIDKKEWNEFVSASKWGDILQFWQWGEVKGNEGWQEFFITSDDKKVRSLALVKKASFLGNILYIPHGPVFHNVEDLKNSISSWKEEIMKFAKEKSCFVIEIDPKIGFLREDKEDLQTGTADKDQLEKAKIRQENIDGLKHFFQKEIIDTFLEAGFKKTKRNMQPIYKLLYSLELYDDNLMKLMEKNTRYNIRYAQKKGVVVKEYGSDDPLIEEKIKKFYDLLKETQQRMGGYPVRPYSSFVELFKAFKGTDNLSFFEVSYEGEVIAMNISERTKNWASSFYAASNRLHPNLKSMYLLRWESIKSAKAYGSRVYDFWGIIPGSKQHKGYSDNKLSFGGTRIDHIGIMQIPVSGFKSAIFNSVLPLRSQISALKRKIF